MYILLRLRCFFDNIHFSFLFFPIHLWFTYTAILKNGDEIRSLLISTKIVGFQDTKTNHMDISGFYSLIYLFPLLMRFLNFKLYYSEYNWSYCIPLLWRNHSFNYVLITDGLLCSTDSNPKKSVSKSGQITIHNPQKHNL